MKEKKGNIISHNTSLFYLVPVHACLVPYLTSEGYGAGELFWLNSQKTHHSLNLVEEVVLQ